MKKSVLTLLLALAFSTSLLPGIIAPTEAAGTSYQTIAVGDGYSLAIKSDGSLWAWGRSLSGWLGDGTPQDRLSPVKIMDGVLSVAAGNSNGFAIKIDGTLWAWGSNFKGMLGDGTVSDGSGGSLTPVKILNDIISVVTGHNCAFAIKNDGSLWAWGDATYGRLGTGSSNSYEPSPYKIMDHVTSVAAGGTHSLAVKSDGSLWAWGYNALGSIGDGTFEDRLTPVKIMDNVVSATAGGSHSMAIKSDGSLWAWGRGHGFYDGLVDDETQNESAPPVKIMDGVVSAADGAFISYVIKNDGNLWAWGRNASGQFIEGVSPYPYSPVMIMEGVASVAPGENHFLALKNDGGLWALGDNKYGQIGDGTTVTRYIPVKIMDDVMQSPGTGPSPDDYDINIKVNGRYIFPDTPPFIESGRTLVPVRAIAEAMKFEVRWYEDTQTINIGNSDVTVFMRIDSLIMSIAYADGSPGKNITLDTAPKIYDSRTYIPLRAVAEAFNASVSWDASSRTASIAY